MPEVDRECHERARNRTILAGSRVTADTGEAAFEAEGTIERWNLLYCGKDSRQAYATYSNDIGRTCLGQEAPREGCRSHLWCLSLMCVIPAVNICYTVQ